MPKILTTGTNSGLGKYLYENLGGAALTRSTPEDERRKYRVDGVDTIIHCAINTAKNTDFATLYQYINDNIFFVRELASYPHKKFIFISSVDVYPKSDPRHEPYAEQAVINVNDLSGIYGITKLMSESIILNSCKNFLVLRPSALLGKYSRKNSLIKIIEDEPCALSVTEDSSFNYVLHSDLLEFIRIVLKNDLTGIYNMVSLGNISLGRIAEILGKQVKFGSVRYDAGNISNEKISRVFPRLNRSSQEVVLDFIKERQ